MNPLDLFLARVQAWLASLMALGFLGLIFVLIAFHASLDETAKTLLTGLAGVLGTIVTQQSGYFFARHRPPTELDNGDDQNPTPGVPTK